MFIGGGCGGGIGGIGAGAGAEPDDAAPPPPPPRPNSCASCIMPPSEPRPPSGLADAVDVGGANESGAPAVMVGAVGAGVGGVNVGGRVGAEPGICGTFCIGIPDAPCAFARTAGMYFFVSAGSGEPV